MELVADHILGRLRQWGAHRVYGYPGDGISGLLGAFDRADGDPGFVGSRYVPDVPHARYAEPLGWRGIYCGDPAQVWPAWEQALASDRPVVLKSKVDSEIAPIPPRIMSSQAKKAAKAMVSDPERVGIGVLGFRQKLADFHEQLPGRDRG